MTQFEYLAALISIVVAVGLSQMLVSLGRLLMARRHVAAYWVHTVWAVLIVGFVILFWWELWQYRELDDWSFFGLIWSILNAMFIVLAVYLIMPTMEANEEHLDLRVFYFETAPLFFGITTVGMASIALSDLVLDPLPVPWTETVTRLAWLPFGLWAAVSRSPRSHAVIAAVAALLFAAFLAASGEV